VKPDWIEYLRSVGFAEPLIERTKVAVKFYTEICKIEPTVLFVSEYRDKQERVFESIFFLNEEMILEAKKFTKMEDFDCIRFRNRISYWDVKSEKFDWHTPKESSRLTIEVKFVHDMYAKFQASGENCLKLLELLKTYIVPNVVK